MRKLSASVLAFGVSALLVGCGGGIPGAECKFKKGEIGANVQGEAKAFLDSALALKQTADSLEAEWNAEIKATAGELQVQTADEDGVLAKINANVQELKVQGQCDVTFSANMDAAAEGQAAGKGSAGTGEATKGSGSASGKAHANVDVKFDAKCRAEAKVKATLDVTTATIRGHFPKLLGISMRYKALLPQVRATADASSKVLGSVSDPLVINELKCAAEAVAGIHAEARVSFSVKASASARGEAKSG